MAATGRAPPSSPEIVSETRPEPTIRSVWSSGSESNTATWPGGMAGEPGEASTEVRPLRSPGTTVSAAGQSPAGRRMVWGCPVSAICCSVGGAPSRPGSAEAPLIVAAGSLSWVETADDGTLT